MKLVPITEVCDFQGGTQPPKSEWSDKPLDGYIRMLQIRDFTQTERTSPEYVKDSGKLKTCYSDDVLIGRYGASIGKILTGLSGAYNVAIVKTIPNEQILNKKFLLCVLKSPSFQNFITTIGARAAQAGFNKSDLAQFSIPILPLDDQIRIAHLLGKIEGLIAQRKQHLQQLDDLLKSVFLEMFGDPVRNEKGWDKSSLGSIASEMRNGLSPSKEGAEKGYVYTLSAITGKKFQEIYKEDTFSHIHKKFYPKDNDFLVCRGNGNIGLVGKGYFYPNVSGEVMFPDTIIAVSIQPNSVDKRFLEALWKTQFIRQQIETNARTTNGTHKINQVVLEKLQIVRPPMDRQFQFARIVENVDTLRSIYFKSLAGFEALYGALSQQAFKGKLDLSRIPMPVKDLDPAKDEISDRSYTEYSVPLSEFFSLPASAATANVQTTEARMAFFGQMLAAWLDQFRSKPFSLNNFMDTVQNQLWKLTEGESRLGINEYDEIKALVFEALKDGHLTQVQHVTGYDDEEGKPIFGNLIELRVGV